MSNSIRTFAELLRQFAFSVDIVSESTFNRVREYVVEYMKNELEAAYFGLMTRSVINGQPGLQTTWSSADQGSAITIRTDEGYTRQVSLSFDQQRPLWVVSAAGTPLRDVPDPSGYSDLWSGTVDLPAYAPPVDRPMRTSIMLPLVRFGRSIGVLYLESTAHVEATLVAQKELEMLAEAIAVLIELRDANKIQVEGTNQAVGQLGRFVSTAEFPRSTKPNLFLASADNADESVLTGIRGVLEGFSSRVSVIDWREIDEAGAITSQIANRIVRSRYGICYFSEPAPPISDHKYVDNPNVIFEAGMLHALVNAPDAPPAGWIPVREEDSPDAPFDFADQRIERVPRENGQVNQARFRGQIQRRLSALLRNDDDLRRLPGSRGT